MGTQNQGAPVAAGREEEMAGYRGLQNTTVRVSGDTKRILDRLREQEGAASFDELIFAVVNRLVQQELPLDLPAPRPGRRAVVLPDSSEDVAELREQVEELQVHVAELYELTGRLAALLDGYARDPLTGALFLWRAEDVQRGPAGKLPKAHGPKHERAGIVEHDRTLFGRNEPESEAGAWLKAPSGAFLTERDGTLPPGALEEIRGVARDEDDAGDEGEADEEHEEHEEQRGGRRKARR